ncbi:Acyl-CoA synthetase (AMP-forming)/AMP-acid ligase II [Parafrankia irregularis]|uniref:Acyl-CoA synthetase (AMP-forming)/AMP-acid ligase II n=1 Tax=Parafrankia irregularis TaxID=795642 RepID=A0A0S4QTF9_9ACTN|nr:MULTISPECIES: AMP-binding protein [Parafrankia]MBE3202371.1 AMP-binding protein [Parafrankia sp. CH37]CUU58881.1 Acyl-CoA synthetase (AMP-forming)/AMP-acid ligase II [Parafrankia irregularis]
MTRRTDGTAGDDPGAADDQAGIRPLINWIDERARNGADRVYLHAARTGRQVTYRQLADSVRRWWHVFDQHGAGPGSRIALVVADPMDFAVAYLAIVAGDRCAAPVPAGAPDLTERLAGLEPDLIVTASGVTTPSRAESGVTAPGRTESGSGRLASVAALPGTGGVLLASSGTTGTPKQVFLDGGRLLHVATEIARHHRLTPADIGYNPLPLVHVNAEVVGLLATLVAGGELVLDARFHRQGFWNLIQNHAVTWINAVPAILAVLARQPAPSAAQTRTVRFVRSASAPLPVAVLGAFETSTGLPVIETYGMTEAASQIAANPLDGRRRPGSVGRAVGTQIRIVDRQGRHCPCGTTGQVQIRGGGVISAYATEAGNDRFRAGGWLDTGDLGRLDEDGYLYLAGRRDDVINRGGEKIFPREVEEVLLADPRVTSAVVFGLPHAVLGRIPVAQVVLADRTAAPDHTADSASGRATGRTVAPTRNGADEVASTRELLADLSSRCATRLERHKRPVRIEVVDDLPVGPTGKVLRHLLDLPEPDRGHAAGDGRGVA